MRDWRSILMSKMLWACCAVASVWAVPAAAQAPIEVMVVGAYHMGNPGQDLANVEADDVTQPQRQREIAAVVDSLATWRPTRVLVEIQRPAPFTVPEYHAFRPAQLGTNRNEIVQLGYRLAHQLGLPDVHGFDEQRSEGEPDYFPFDRLQARAAQQGEPQRTSDMLNFFRSAAEEESRLQAQLSVAQLLLRHNDPQRDRNGHARGYYSMLSLGDADNQVGAEFNAYWYMRNAKMFAKIALIARPGDRVLVLVGSGHRYWLSHFVEMTPGFTAVDPRPYLERVARQSR